MVHPALTAPPGHLARRFVGALWPGGPPAADEAWARGQLLEGERALWARMSGPDRRHAVAVARRTATRLVEPTRPVLAAALLHDVGKVEAGLGTLARVPATLVGTVVGRDRAGRWATGRGGARGRVGRYLCHDRLGAALLAAAGSDALTVAWAGEHHLPAARWTVPPAVGAALKAADDD